MKNTEKSKIPIANLYGVQDRVAQRFFPPFLSENDQAAVRSFKQMATSDQSSIAQSPSDYLLYKFGDFDPSDGQIDLLDGGPDFLISAADFFNSESDKSEKS